MPSGAPGGPDAREEGIGARLVPPVPARHRPALVGQASGILSSRGSNARSGITPRGSPPTGRPHFIA